MNRRLGIGIVFHSLLIILSLGLAASAQAQTPTAKWVYHANAGIEVSGAAMDTNQALYFGDSRTTMYAVTNGNAKWTASVPSGTFVGANSPCLSADGKTVYFTLDGQALTARSTADGSELWTFYAGTNSVFGELETTITSPTVGPNGSIYFTGWDGVFYAISSFGQLEWTNTLGAQGSCGAAAVGPDGTIYVPSTGFNGNGPVSLYGFNPDGSIKVQTLTTSGDFSRLAIDSDGSIYVSGPEGVYGFAPGGASVSWKYWWTPFYFDPIEGGPVIGANATLYYQYQSVSNFVAAQSSAGNPGFWSIPFPLTSVPEYSTPAVAADGTLYLGSSSNLYALSPNGSVLWTFPTGDLVYSPPTIGNDGTVYVGSLNGNFYAIPGSAPLANTPWPKFGRDLQNSGNAGGVLSVPLPPAGLTAIAGNAQVQLTWNASAGATTYHVKQSTTSGGPYTTVGTLTSTSLTPNSFTISGLVNAKTYYFVVSALNGTGESTNSSQLSVAPVAPPPVPGGLHATAGNAQVVLTWNASSGATSYNVKSATTSGGPYTTIASRTSTGYTNTSLVNGTTYYYVVSALKGTSESANSSQVSATPQPPAPPAPTGLTATPGNTLVVLNWNAASGATSYNVKRSTTSGGPYTTVASPTSTGYTNTGLVNGKTYYYVVSAVNGGGQSANSSQVSVAPVAPPPVPGGLHATAGNAQVALTWNASSGATSYNVKSATTSGGPYTTIANSTSTSYTDTSSVNGTTYYYVVSALKGISESTNSSQVSATPEPPAPPAPTGLTATPGNTLVILSWNTASGATSYNVKRATTSGGPYTTIASPTSTSYMDTGLVNGTTYYYVVSAVNGGGQSANSSQITAVPSPACVPAPSGIVGWWPADGNANDVISGDNGTLEGGATFAAGEVGQGFRLDGTNAFVQIPDSAALKPTNVTVEAWVWLDPNLPTNNGAEQIVFKKNTADAFFEGYSLSKQTIDNGDGTSSDHFQFTISNNGDQVSINSQTIVQRGIWYHVAATYDGNQSILYVNGVAEASAIAGFALDYDTTPVFIGTTGTTAPYLSMLGGTIDEVSIYNRSLTAIEIQSIYITGSAGKCTPPPLCVTPPSSLVGWWPAEGNANDVISGDNGTLEGGATFAAGEVRQGFRLDGTNAYVQIPDSAALKPTNVTVEAWVWLDPNLPSTNGGEQIVFKKNTWSAWFEGYSLLKETVANGDGTSSDRFQFCISHTGDQVAINSQTIVQRGVWYHVAATYDGNQSILYVNGVAEASAIAGFALDYDTTPVFIGTTGTWAPYLSMFGGIIDEVSIYNQALTAAEIQSIYNAGSAGKCATGPSCVAAPSGLAGWWPAEGNANDIIGGDNGTLEGGATFAAGEVGQGFRLDGTNSYVQVPDSAALKPTNVTVEAWVWLDPNLPSDNGGEQIVFKKNTLSAFFEGYSLAKQTINNGGTNSDHFQFCISSQNGYQVAINSQTITQRGVWYHVAATYDGNQSILYVNGVAEASSTPGFALNYDTTPIFFGTTGTWAPYLNMFGGVLDEVSIYDRALTAAEIESIYTAGSAGKCPP